MASIVERPRLLYPAALGLAALVGALACVDPRIAVGLIGAVAVVRLAWPRPVHTLVVVVFLTAVVPYGVQKLFGLSHPGLLPSDALLLLGIAWSVVIGVRMRFDRRWALMAGLVALYLALATLQLVHGLRAGNALSDAGFEWRIQLGLGAFFVAALLLRDSRTRGPLLKGLLAVAVVLGFWGVYQYVGKLPLSISQDYGVRQGVALTANGKGQVQGGLYGFGVAVTMLVAAVMSGALSPRARRWVWVGIVLNLGGLLLTFERTFWVATFVAVAVVVLRAGRARRARALLLAPVVAVCGFAVLSAVAPAELTTARERLLSIGQAAQSDSIRYRLVESRHVEALVRERPLGGWGLGARVYWGRPWQLVPASYFTYSHNGYLWIAWKLGIPALLLLLAILGGCLAFRAPPAAPVLLGGLRNGAQASLLMLLVASVTFPAFNTQSITVVMGVLLALACLPPRAEADVAIPAPV